MNTIYHRLGKGSQAILVFAVLLFAGCGKNKTGAELNTATLVGSGGSPWNVSSVMIDNTDKTSMYTGMTLRFTADTYTTTHGSVVWPASGKWSFAASDGKVIKRDDGLEVTITEIGNSKLVLALDWTKTTFSGRSSSISGHHVFNFAR